MVIVRGRINRWIEGNGMIGVVKGVLRKGQMTEDNLFIMERIKEMARMKK